jgi:hypothetical protein
VIPLKIFPVNKLQSWPRLAHFVLSSQDVGLATLLSRLKDRAILLSGNADVFDFYRRGPGARPGVYRLGAEPD